MLIHVPAHVKTGGFIPDSATIASLKQSLADVSVPKVTGDQEFRKSAPVNRSQAFPSSVAAVNDHLIPFSDALSADEIRMLTTTILWIQHALIGYCTTTLGWSKEKFSDPAVRNSTEFFDAIAYVVEQYCGWVMVGDLNHRTYDGNINIMSAVGTSLKVVVGEDAAEMLAQGAALLASDNQGAGVSDVGNFFWNQKYQSQSQCQFSVSPAIKDESGSVYYAYLSIYESTVQNDWRTLFVQSHYDGLTLSTCIVPLRLGLDLWNRVKNTVEERVSQWLDQVKNAPLG